ncbi:MAG TPA: thioredoxin-disulfide reductase [Patescibacteria group bacterium]|nr:thioredoxin-disulfide reductase [Patescibacteria group bacterium]
MQKEKLLIIGSGPAGLTAALYTGRAGLSPKVFVGPELGGQISLTWTVENYPGFPDSISGAELVDRLAKQAKRWGATLVTDVVKEVDFIHRPFRIRTTKEEYHTGAVIVTTGATPKKLHVPGETEFTGKGVSYCATCDGPLFREKDVVVVGGGDTAIEEALFLTKFCKKIFLAHRRDSLKATPVLQELAKKNEKIQFLWNTEIKEIQGKDTLEKVKIWNSKTQIEDEISVHGVFVFIGQTPNTSLFEGKLAMTKSGHIIVDERKHTDIDGVFAAGECEDSYFKQIATAVGDGCRAGMEAERFLSKLSEQDIKERR